MDYNIFDLLFEGCNNNSEVYVAEDVILYQPTYTLVGNQPLKGSGLWMLTGGSGTIQNPTNYQTSVTDLGPGKNTFRWTITVDGCQNFDEMNIEYLVMPTVNYTIDNFEGCPPVTVQFINSSINRSDAGFLWDFGDGVTAMGEIVTHVYNQPGSYTARLTTTGPNGASVYKDTVITVFDVPEADFNVAPEIVYIPEMRLQCYDNSSFGYTYLWDFGDSITATEKNPVHWFTDTGTFNITLHVWSENNCYDYITKENFIQVIESGKVEFPSAFSPDPAGENDGHYSEKDYNNDVFHPIIKGVTEYHLEIYNRWGIRIFESDDVTVGWNGYYKGKTASEDVYIYRVYGRYNNGRQFDFVKDFLLIQK
jgi:PKD repeat protein